MAKIFFQGQITRVYFRFPLNIEDFLYFKVKLFVYVHLCNSI